MRSYNQNNIRIKIPAKWTGDDALYLIIRETNDEGDQVNAITTEELRDILYLGTKIFIENDRDLLKVDHCTMHITPHPDCPMCNNN